MEGAVKEAEADGALWGSEARYRALFESDFFCVYLHDLEGRYLDANDTALKLLGYTRDEITSITFPMLVHPDDLPKAFEDLREILGTGSQSKPTTYRLVTKSGGLVWIETDGRLICREGKPHAIQGVARDITERRRAEEEKAALEEQLRHAQKMEAIGSLASGIAHDFNNLLTGILGHADLLKLASRPGDEVFEAADVIEKASTRASELTRQLLGFAQRGKQQNVPVE